MSVDHVPGTFFGPPTLVDLVRHRSRHQADDLAFTFLVDGENEQLHMTHRELDLRARAIAAWLESSGLVGERALLLYPAGLDFICAFFGCLYAGVVAVPVYPPRRNRSLGRIQAIAKDADAKVALTTDVVLNRVQQVIEQTPDLKNLMWLPTCRVPAGIERQWEQPDIDGETIAFLQYTSGSTGTPKGVVLNHNNLIHNSALIAFAFEHTRSGKGVFWLPSYHDMGLIGGILQPLYVGRPNVLMSPMAFLQNPYRWLSAITRFGGTTSGGPNFAYDLCVQKVKPEQLKTLDLRSWKVAFNGAEPIRDETVERFSERFGPCGFRREAFYPCYGLAEATLIVSGGYAEEAPVIGHFEAEALENDQVVDGEPGDEGVRGLVGCGQCLPDQKLVIADPQKTTRCPPDQVGEVWVSGPSVAQGYWRRPEETKATFRARLKDTGEGRFLRTGDLGFLRDGELFVTGRIKDLIILHGLNHYPQDIEKTVQQSHPRLRPGCGGAFAIDVEGRQELVVVQEVERRKHGELDAIFDAVRRDVMAEHELGLYAVVLVKAGSVPKTSSGKIQRHACRQGYLEATLQVVAEWCVADAKDRPPAAVRRKETKKPAPQTSAPTTAMPETPLPGPDPISGNGKEQKPASTVEAVLEQVRLVAKERAAGLTLDTAIADMGLDSLERMEIVASLEERFGGRFPEEILPEMETCRQVVEAVERYLGTQPRPARAIRAGEEVPPACYRFDQFPEYLKLRENLSLLESTGIGNPYFSVHEGVTNNRTVIGGRELINFSSYNYVGMSGDAEVVKAAQQAAARYGTSVSASRLASGEKPLHGELESALARFVGVESSVVFVGGHSTNETTIGHLLGPGDLILHDALAHNSIVQGCILSGARRRPFAHNDWQAADELLRQFRHEYRRVLLAIEGVYSMDGDIPDLPKFIEVKRRHKVLLMIDEAHSAGVLGEHGRGIGEHFGIDPRDVDIWMGTLSKSFGSCGGYIAGCKELAEYLKYTAPGFVFSVGMSPPNTAAALASLRRLEAEPERVARLHDRSSLFLALARQRGLDTGMSQNSPVVPIIVGSSMRALRLARALLDRGVNVQPMVYPAVEESAARLRFFITSEHSEEEIRYTVQAAAEELEKIDPTYRRRGASGEETLEPVQPGG